MSGDFVLGIDFGGTKIDIATGRSDGTVLARRRLPTEGDRGALQAVERALDSAHEVAGETASTGEAVLAAVGVSTMGITLEDRVMLAPNVVGWTELALPSLLQAAFPEWPVTIENDVKAAAWAEVAWGRLREVPAGIHLNLGTGIGAALVLDGRVVRGAHGGAGEIAYNMRSRDELEGARAGRAPLEEAVGGGALARRIRTTFGPESTVEVLIERSARGDAEATELLEELFGEVAFHVTNLAIAFDPAVMTVAGGLMAAAGLVLPRLRRSLAEFAPFPPEVVPAHFAHEPGVMGALALAASRSRQE